jgi:hypothetical protein
MSLRRARPAQENDKARCRLMPARASVVPPNRPRNTTRRHSGRIGASNSAIFQMVEGKGFVERRGKNM